MILLQRCDAERANVSIARVLSTAFLQTSNCTSRFTPPREVRVRTNGVRTWAVDIQRGGRRRETNTKMERERHAPRVPSSFTEKARESAIT